MTEKEEKKKKLFIWLTSIGSIIIFILFIWSMKISLSGIGDIKVPKLEFDTSNLINNEQIEELKQQLSTPEEKSEVQKIINLIEQDASKLEDEATNSKE